MQLSNHGGRQLDRTVPPVSTIAAVRDRVGPDVSVLVDSGIRHGSDIAVALALGADACAIGRAYLYGLMAGGEAGVNKALDILAAQFKRTMQLLGVRSVAELRELGPSLLATREWSPAGRPATRRRSSRVSRTVRAAPGGSRGRAATWLRSRRCAYWSAAVASMSR